MSRSISNDKIARSLAGGTAGQVPYQSGPSVTDFAGPGTSGQVLTSNGASGPTFQNVPGTSNISGGTTGQVVYQSAVSTTAFTGPGSAGTVLTSNGVAAPTFQSIPSPSSLSGGTAGQIVYQSAPGVSAFAGPGTSGQFLRSNGTSAPSYASISVTQPTYVTYAGGASGTYTSPAGCTYMIVEMCGGGGGGAKNNTSSSGGGGTGSTYFKLRVPAGSYSYSVGAAGSGGTIGNNGTAGGNTTFGSATSGGGGGGQTGGTPGAFGSSTSAYTVLMSVAGARGSGRAPSDNSAAGGQSFLGTAATSQSTIYLPNANDFATAGGYGAGGAGIDVNFSGNAGSGGDGRIIITEFY